MAMRLVNGDYVPDGNGGFCTVHGAEAVLDQVLFRLTARRAAFPFLPQLGSRLYLLGREKPSVRLSAAKQYVLEALADETELELNDVAVVETADGQMELIVRFAYHAQQFSLTTEV